MNTAVTAASQGTKPTQWQIDPAHSAAHFSVRHLMISNVRGEFTKLSGSALIDPADPTKSSVEVTIEAASLNTREPQRDEHLRSADFFDVANIPTMTFRSKRIEASGPGAFQADRRSDHSRRHQGSHLRRGRSDARGEGSLGQHAGRSHGIDQDQPQRFRAGLERLDRRRRSHGRRRSQDHDRSGIDPASACRLRTASQTCSASLQIGATLARTARRNGTCYIRPTLFEAYRSAAERNAALTDHGKTSRDTIPIHELIGRRWSPRAFSDRPVEPDKLLGLFEAARWAASASNEQPWAFLVATREDPKNFEDLLGVLVEFNRAWAQRRPY